MNTTRFYFLCLIILFSFSFNAGSQVITGTWEGRMSGEFIQINVEQRGNQLCGYTYDYGLDNRSSYCIAKFEGVYDPERKLWYLSGRTFIENSGSHVFMRIILRQNAMGEKNEMTAQVYTPSYGGNFGEPDQFTVRKISARPQSLGSRMEPCFPKASPPISKTTPPKPATPKINSAPPVVKAVPKTEVPMPVTKPPVVTKPAPQAKTVPPVVTQPKPQPQVITEPIKKAPAKENVPLVQTVPDRDITKKMNARKRTEQSRLEINVKKINLKVYDNGVVDNDTVSIFYNGRLLLSHQRLSETPIEFNLDLDEGVTQNEIIMYAENLGGIPPNTALIVITAGSKRYELRSKASLVENAVLVIEYKPEPDI
jgi:hypothetical protein